MASDGDRKAPPKDDDGPLDLMADDSNWDAAIEEWDQALDLPFDESAPPAPPAPVQVAPTTPSPEDQRDPLVDLIQGEMDLPDDPGEALGSLLGSPALDQRIARAPAGRIHDEEQVPADIGLSPDEVIAADTEVEVAPRGEPPLFHDEPTPAVLVQPPPEEPSLVSLDLDGLMEGLDSMDRAEESRAEPAPPPSEPSFPADDIPVLAETSPGELESVPPPLEAFEEIGPAAVELEPIEVSAGEVLPAPAEPLAAPAFLAEEIEEVQLEEPELPPPPIPEHLATFEPALVMLPEQGAPVTPLPAYWERLTGLLSFETGLTDSGTRAAALELTVARAWEECGDLDEASDHYREVLHHQPGHVPAMRALRRVYAARNEPDQLAEILEMMAPRVGEEERRALQFTRAELLWSKTGDESGARDLLDSLSQEMPGELRGLLLRADLAAASSDDEELTAVVSAIAEKVKDAKVNAALHVEQGRALEVLGRAADARKAYRTAAPSGGAGEGLIRVCEQAGDAAGMAAALAETAQAPGLRNARRLRRAAQLARNRNVADFDAVAQLLRATERAPDDVLVAEDLAEALRSAGDPAAAVEAYASVAAIAPEDSRRAVALIDAAQIAFEQLDDPGRALEMLAKAAERSPGSPAAEAYASQLRMLGSDPELQVEAHRVAAAAGSGTERAAHHLEAALLLMGELDAEEDAVQELVDCLEHDPTNRTALVCLDRLYRKTGTLDKLAAVVDTSAGAAENPVDANGLRVRAALLYEGRLANPSAAASRYREVVENDPANIPARLGLARSLAALRNKDELAEALSQEAMSTGSASRAASLWTACGDLLWSDGKKEEAEASFKMAFDRVPDHTPAVLALTLLYGTGGRWSNLAELWAASLEGMPSESPQRKAQLMRLGALQEFELEDPVAALASFEAALAEPDPTPGALEGLLRVARKANQPERLIKEIERELEASSDQGPLARFAVLITAGELALTAGLDWTEAEDRFRRALAEVPGDPVARLALERLYTERLAWQPLADLYLEDLKREIPDSERIETYERLAELDVQRGDTESARLSCESIADLAPAHLGALRFIQQKHIKEEQHDRLAVALRRQAEAAGTSDATALWLELGRLLANHPPLEQTPEAEPEEAPKTLTEREAYLAAVERDPVCVFALRHLVDAALLGDNLEDAAELYVNLAAAVGRGKEAAVYLTRAGEYLGDRDLGLYREAIDRLPEYLGPIYRLRDAALRAEDWETAVFAAEAEVKASHHREHRTTAALLAGEIAQHKLADRERAVTAYKAALADAPESRVAFRELQQFLEEDQRWEELVELLSTRASVERSRARLTDLHRTLARLTLERLSDQERAKGHLRALVKLNPEDTEALFGLAELYEAGEQWTEAANAMIRLARLEQDAAGLRDIFLRLGRIYHEKSPDNQRAIVSLKKVLAMAPEHPEALERLSQLYMAELDHQQALAMTNQLLEQENTPERRVELLLRAGKIHEDGLKDTHMAAISYRQAVEVAPTDLDAIGAVIGFFVRQGDQRSLMVHLDRSVATMQTRLRQDALDAFAYRALFRIFGWRKAPDGCFCAAQVLDALGQANPEERNYLASHLAGVGAPGKALADLDHDEWLFDRSIPGGFRQVFKLLAEPFAKYYPGDIKGHGATRSDRIADVDHPIRRIGDALAKDIGVPAYEVFVLKSKPNALIVENTDPPAILIGKALLHEATESEVQFMMGRSLWIIGRSMILPAFLRREDLELLVAGIVRQYQTEFQPEGVEYKALQDTTKRVGKAIPRKLKNELMPFALECSGPTINLRSLAVAVVHSANRAGLLTCRSIFAALSVLCRMAGQIRLPSDPEERTRTLRAVPEATELLRFSVSEAHFELRRGMHVGIR